MRHIEICLTLLIGLMAVTMGRAYELPAEAKNVPATIEIPKGPFEPNWPSLEKYQTPDWFRDGKFGIFVHWGPQTLAGEKDGSKDGSKTSNWQDYARAFTGEKFDAADMAKKFRRAGAKYVVQVAEHHDGYALYDSTLTPWSSVKMTPKRDFVAELAAAVRKEGMIYGASSHTEENWWFYDKPPKKAPPAPAPGRPVPPQPDKAFLDWWYARLVEIVEKYHPQFMWFDWCIQQPAYEPYLQKFAAYYYNRAAEWKTGGVVINYKYQAFPVAAAVLDISVGTGTRWEEGVHATPWQFDTESNFDYWFWRPGMKMRPVADLLGEMADVVSKNGNYLLNFPPAPDGTLTPGQEEVLDAMGRWFDANGEAIYGTRPWKTFGEGPTPGLGPSFKMPKTSYTAKDFRFTTKGNALYAIGLAWPENSKAVIASLASGSKLRDREITHVSLLGAKSVVKWTREASGLAVELPEWNGGNGGNSVYVLKIE